MSDKSVLYSLSRSLPERERREMLEKINRSLSLKDRPEENIHRTPVSPEERINLVELEVAELDWFNRFILWITGMINGKPRIEAFQLIKLNNIRKKIRRSGSSLVDFPGRQLNASMAERLYSLYQTAYPLIPLFRKFWHDPSFFGQMVMNLLEKKVHEPKSLVTDIVSLEEMKQIYMTTERKEDIRSELIQKLSRYINDIPKEIFNETESGLLPLYYLKNIVLFNYTGSFPLFI